MKTKKATPAEYEALKAAVVNLTEAAKQLAALQHLRGCLTRKQEKELLALTDVLDDLEKETAN